jgi:DNA-binding transcriptional ArsR family regulator
MNSRSRSELKKLAKERAEIYQIFSNENRVLIFWNLAHKYEMTVNELAESIGSTVQNTSQHLRLMKAKNILEASRDGQMIHYRIADTSAGRYSIYIHRKNFQDIRDQEITNDMFDFDIQIPDDFFDR